MSNRHGTPIWYELMTEQPDNALKFYAAVMSWSFEAIPSDPTMGYHIENAGKETP